MVKVAICTPVRIHVYHEAPICALRAMQHLKDAGFDATYLYLPGGALLEHFRSWIACEALNWGAEVLLWVDDDVTFDAPEAVKLVRGCLATEGLVAGVCALRGASRINVTPTDQAAQLRFYEGGGLIDVNHAGLGMTAVHRKVYERMAKEWEPVTFYDKPVVPYYRTRFWDGLWPGEDYSFTRLMLECGMQPKADTSIRAVHHGDYGFRLEDVVKGFAANSKTLRTKQD